MAPLTLSQFYTKTQTELLEAGAKTAEKFFVPTAEEIGIGDELVFLKVMGNWSSALRDPGPCLAIVEQPEVCAETLFENVVCNASPLWNLSLPDYFLGFELIRPLFTLGNFTAHNHSVCLHTVEAPSSEGEHIGSAIVLGRVHYFNMPKTLSLGSIIRIGVRSFLNPGWQQNVRIFCGNCSELNLIGVRPLKLSRHCAKWLGHHGSIPPPDRKTDWRGFRVSGRHFRNETLECHLPQQNPCMGYVENALMVGTLDSIKNDTAEFMFSNHERVVTKDRGQLFHHHSALCFYPHNGSPNGRLLGYATFHMASHDVQAFIGFVCFFGIALPLICIITGLLHLNKRQRCKFHVREARLQFEREHLEQELISRRTHNTSVQSPPSWR